MSEYPQPYRPQQTGPPTLQGGHPQAGPPAQSPAAPPAQQGGGSPVAMGLQMKRRNPVGAWLGLPLITLGIYNLCWYYLVHAELARFDARRSISPGAALCSLLFGWITLGIWPLITWVKLGGHIRDAQQAAGLQPTCSPGLGFLVGIFGFGVLYYQIELNKIPDRYGDTQPGAQVPLMA